jgi:hypothetical protein
MSASFILCCILPGLFVRQPNIAVSTLYTLSGIGLTLLKHRNLWFRHEGLEDNRQDFARLVD